LNEMHCLGKACSSVLENSQELTVDMMISQQESYSLRPPKVYNNGSRYNGLYLREEGAEQLGSWQKVTRALSPQRSRIDEGQKSPDTPKLDVKLGRSRIPSTIPTIPIFGDISQDNNAVGFLELFAEEKCDDSTRSLNQLLDDPATKEKFRAHLQAEYSGENLMFWEEVQRFKRLPEWNVVPHACFIYDQFVRENAPYEINLPHEVKAHLVEVFSEHERGSKTHFRAINKEIYEQAQMYIFDTMKFDSLKRFNQKQLRDQTNAVNLKVRHKKWLSTGNAVPSCIQQMDEDYN